MEDDWVMNFFDKCRLVSDEKMQAIWSKILSGEANSPGQFAERTVNIVGGLEKFEVELFSALCRFVIHVAERDEVVVINEKDPIYSQAGITFGILNHLADIGLIQFGIASLFYEVNQTNRILYFDQMLDLSFPPGRKCTLNLGQATLSLSGAQLLSLMTQLKPVDGFIEYLGEFWKKHGITLARV